MSVTFDPFPPPLTIQVRRSDEVEFVTSVELSERSRVRAIRPSGEVPLSVNYEWRSLGREVWELRQHVQVTKSRTGGFCVSTWLQAFDGIWSDAEAFAPGMIYGRAPLPAEAIGSLQGYSSGVRHWLIREDRLPAPLLGLYRPDGTGISILHADPRGQTSVEDADDVSATEPLIDAGVDVLSLGAAEQNGCLRIGFAVPGGEGEVTYRGDCYPGGQMRAWRRRYLPFEAGLTRQHTMLIRVGRFDAFADFTRDAWRWAWQVLQPKVAPVNLNEARDACLDVLAANAIVQAGKAGFNDYLPADTGVAGDVSLYMGFTGRSTESAYELLATSRRSDISSSKAENWRAIARATFDSFATLPLNPPAGEGFRNGVPHVHPYMGRAAVVYVRSLCEGARAAVEAWKTEREGGHDRPAWLAWATSLGEWLLSVRAPDGGLPRAVRAGSGEIVEPAPGGSLMAVPFLLALADATRDDRFLRAAWAAGDCGWRAGGASGRFIGGTNDNPDVIDKEAGTLALHACLDLLAATNDPVWLDRAKQAAEFAETWIYLWNIPLPPGSDATRGWKHGCTTVGSQLIATGHSLVDQYMAFDAGRYARLAQLTGDEHFAEVAELLVHNTKSMLALPGRTWDLAALGYQQEHWSHAPPRGRGLHRGWLPWIACAHLTGIREYLAVAQQPAAGR